MMNLDDLRAAAPPGADVEAFLDALGIPHGGGLVARVMVERALGLGDGDARRSGGAPAIAVARTVFERAGINMPAAVLKRGWNVELVARQHRRIYSELHEEDPRAWPAIDLREGVPLGAKLYLASKRNMSTAHFLVSGLDAAPDDRLFIFVLVPEERVWLATARELRMLQRVQDDDVGDEKAKMKKKYGRVGASRAKLGRSAVKVWFPVGNTSFDAEYQIRDRDGQHVLPIVQHGGRER